MQQPFKVKNMSTSLSLKKKKRHKKRKKRKSCPKKNKIHVSFHQPSQLRWRPRLFISHCWTKDLCGRDNHARVKMLNNTLLCSNKVDTWFDETSMRSDLTQSMCNGIDNCDIVLVCISRAYINKCQQNENDNCKLELNYAYERKGCTHLLPVVMEEDCLLQRSWGGPVGAYLNKHLYVPCTNDNQMFGNIELLLQHIAHIMDASTHNSISPFYSFGLHNIIHHWRSKNKTLFTRK